MSTNLAKRDETAIARLDPQALISAALEHNAGVETLERLVALAKDVRAEQAREAWHEAMASFQRAAPAIKKTSTAKVQTKTGGSYSYQYAPLDEIMAAILPVMGPLGLSVSWRTKMDAGQVVASCRISHALGHHEDSGEVAMPIGTDERGATPPQRVGIAMTYAKRYSLLSIIGLAPEDDDDAARETNTPKVQQPKRASAAKAAPAESPGDEESLVYQGPIRGVKKAASGVKDDGSPWTLYAITGEDWEGVTFSSSDADLARSYIESGVELTIDYHLHAAASGKRSNTIDSIEEPVPL